MREEGFDAISAYQYLIFNYVCAIKIDLLGAM
jgi:hypothetical protein